MLHEIEVIFLDLADKKAEFYSHESSILDSLLNFSFINISGCLDFFPRARGLRRPLFSKDYKSILEKEFPEAAKFIGLYEAWWESAEDLRHEAAHGNLGSVPPIIRGEENTERYHDLCGKSFNTILEHGRKRLTASRSLSPSLESIRQDIAEFNAARDLADSYQNEANSLLECHDIFGYEDRLYPLTRTLREWSENVCHIINFMVSGNRPGLVECEL